MMPGKKHILILTRTLGVDAVGKNAEKESCRDRLVCLCGCALVGAAFMVLIFSPQMQDEPAATPLPQPTKAAAVAAFHEPAQSRPAQEFSGVSLPEKTPALMLAVPVPGKVCAGYSSLPQESAVEGWYLPHDGVDFQAEPGTPVCAPLAGTVQSVDFGLQGGSVTITAGNVQVTLRGLAQVLVQPGDLAAAGDALGTAGAGLCPGVHLQLMIDGVCTDPAPYLP